MMVDVDNYFDKSISTNFNLRRINNELTKINYSSLIIETNDINVGDEIFIVQKFNGEIEKTVVKTKKLENDKWIITYGEESFNSHIFLSDRGIGCERYNIWAIFKNKIDAENYVKSSVFKLSVEETKSFVKRKRK